MTLLDHTREALERFDPGERPLVCAGRRAGEVGELPEAEVLGEWDVLPVRLAEVLEGATALVLLDTFSFPYEAAARDLQNVPLVVFPPPGRSANFLDTVFGEPLFEGLGFFDRIVLEDDAVWEVLSGKYRWAGRQRIPAPPEGFAEGANAAPRRLLETLLSRPEERERAARRGRTGKAFHRAQSAALGPQFLAARGERAPDVPFEVLQVGAEDGRWATSFDPETTRFCGACPDREAVEAAREDFPRARFGPLGREGVALPEEDESFDLVFSVDALRRLDASSKRKVLSEMWRVARPGGRLLFLEDFVFERGRREEGVEPTSVRAFVALLWEATAGQVVLEHVQSVRYPGDDFVRAGVVSLSKLGVPRRW